MKAQFFNHLSNLRLEYLFYICYHSYQPRYVVANCFEAARRLTKNVFHKGIKFMRKYLPTFAEKPGAERETLFDPWLILPARWLGRTMVDCSANRLIKL